MLLLMTKIICMSKEILDTIKEIKKDCELLKKEDSLTSFGEGQLKMADILLEIMEKWINEEWINEE